MKPKSMVIVKQEIPRGSVLVNNLNNVSQQPSVIANSELLRCKRKMGFVPGQSYPGPQPASVARRNARERNRVKQVNNGFATLRSHIPPALAAALTTEKPSPRSSAANKKLSKVDTLKMAVEYIRSLQQLLDEDGGPLEKKSSHSYELEDAYYSSSPETIVSGENNYYPNSPENYQKSEPLDNEFYSNGRNFIKSENYSCFNQDVHEALTAEFYHARSPIKSYSSPERELPEDGLTTLTTILPNHAFIQPRTQQRNSTSLSPPMSDPCPSPTPSYASDHSSLHPSSVVSSSSGHLTTQLSRLTTAPAQQQDSRRGSPEGYDCGPMSPEDEELLDVITWWQQTN